MGSEPTIAPTSADDPTDPVRRREILGRVWAAEVLAHIDAVVARRPGARVVRTSRIDAPPHHLARFAWHVRLADGTALPEGLDLAELTPDGRIRRIFGPLT